MSISADVRDAAAACLRKGSVRTPFYLLAFDEIVENAKAYRGAWLKAFPRARAFWSYKTNPLSEIGAGLRAVGYAAEVTNISEFAWALADGHEPLDVIVNGPAKPASLLSEARRTGALAHIDSLEELDIWLASAGADADRLGRVGFRLAHRTPDGRTSRFGLTPDEVEIGLRLLSGHGVRLSSLHLHTPAQHFPSGRLEALCDHQELVRQLYKRDPTLRLDIGGGDPPPERGRTIHSSLKGHIAQVRALLDVLGVDPDRVDLALEPGRAIVEDSGALATMVLSRKRRGDETLLICDARSECLQSRRGGADGRLETLSLGDVAATDVAPSEDFIVYGSHCYEADLAIRARLPAETKQGSVLLFGGAGGYDLATAGSWSGPRPAAMLLRDGRVARCAWREHVAPDAVTPASGVFAKDALFDGPWPEDMPFSFSKDVVDVFDNMIARSVPLHDELQDVTARLAVQLTKGAPVVDLGCSTGATLMRIASLSNAPLDLVGIDASSAMIARAREKLEPFSAVHRVTLRCQTIADIDYSQFEAPGVVVMNLVAQFMRPLERQREIERVYQSLSSGGAFLLVEKVLDECPDISALYIREYHQRKIAHGYSEQEVTRKREALENRLIPFHPSENVAILRDAGFCHVSIYFTWLNFQGYLAIKDVAANP